MNKTRELIRDEQVARDANVNEYLRLSAQADKQQQTRLKVTTRKVSPSPSPRLAAFGGRRLPLTLQPRNTRSRISEAASGIRNQN